MTASRCGDCGRCLPKYAPKLRLCAQCQRHIELGYAMDDLSAASMAALKAREFNELVEQLTATANHVDDCKDWMNDIKDDLKNGVSDREGVTTEEYWSFFLQVLERATARSALLLQSWDPTQGGGHA